MKSALKQIEKEIYSIFDHLHQNPEISWEEVQTTQFIKEILEKEGYQVQTFDDCTGVVGEIGEGDLTVALRADMDALWQEERWKMASHSFLWTRFPLHNGSRSGPFIQQNGVQTTW